MPPACITIKLRIWNVNITMTLIPIKLLNFISSFFRIENLGLYTLHFSIRQIFPKVVTMLFCFVLPFAVLGNTGHVVHVAHIEKSDYFNKRSNFT